MKNKQIIKLWNEGKAKIKDYRLLNGEIVFIFGEIKQ